ncbi:MAG: glycerate kinase [Clostridiaceae bacterium]|nr:glycerate kinase [Clostridiaceae bacterium]
MRKIVLAPDSFKGTMSSIEVCAIAAEGIRAVSPEIETVQVPIADGGEGTVDAFLVAAGGKRRTCKALDPLFREIESFYGILPDGRTAVIEMAAASGLPLVGDDKNPLLTTTYGTGQLIADAIEQGCRRLIIGIGGSATNDGGCGMAAALGARFLDAAGAEIPLNGGGLARLDHIDVSRMLPLLRDCEIIVACDVDNPLVGPEGASAVFGPQKGADPAMAALLDENLRHYASVIQRDLGPDLAAVPGAGAAGGLGAGLLAFTGASVRSGIDTVLDCVHFDDLIRDADLIITGEGRIDGQSLRGKVPVGIAARAAKQGVPVIAVVGDIGDDAEKVYQAGIQAVFSTMRRPLPFEIARCRCRQDLRATIESLMRFAAICNTRY